MRRCWEQRDPPCLPPMETRIDFMNRTLRLPGTALELEGKRTRGSRSRRVFEVQRPRAWVLARRFTHSAHHRGQLNAYLRLWGGALHSIDGPTADTGGLPKDGAKAVYRYASIADLLAHESGGGSSAALPGPGAAAPTERPDTGREDAGRAGTATTKKGIS